MRDNTIEYAETLKRINTLYTLLGYNRGGSVNMITGDYTTDSGYFITILVIKTYKTLSEINPHEIHGILKSLNQEKLFQHNIYLGGWYDVDKNCWEIGLSVHTNNLQKALITASVLEERYVWDALEGENISVKEIDG